MRAALLAIATGALCGIGVWLFKLSIRGLEWLAHGWHAKSWGEVGLHPSILAPIIGGLIVGLILHFTRSPDPTTSTITQIIKSTGPQNEEYPVENTPAEAASAAISIASGAALGQSDPATGLGGTVGKLMGGRDFIIVGASAALAAAFHAPIAAGIFAIEVFKLRDKRFVVFTAIAIAIAYLVHGFLDIRREPEIAAYSLMTVPDLMVASVIGVAAGVLSVIAIRATHGLLRLFQKVRFLPRIPRILIGGAGLTAAAVISTSLLGLGFPALEKVVSGTAADTSQLFGFAIGKTLLMAWSIGSGFVGGFFAPSLFTGASLGAGIANVMNGMLPTIDVLPHALALAGMAAMIAGNMHAPITGTVLVLELTSGFRPLPATLLAALIAFGIARMLERGSVYTYPIVHPPEGHSP